MKIALAQMAVERARPDLNLKRIQRFVAEAGEAGARLLCLPEMATTGFDWAKNRELRDTAAEAIETVSALARTHGVAICGSFLEATESGRSANTLYYMDDRGRVRAKYRKVHLFTLFHEEKHVEAGDTCVVADTELGKVGCSVCYDLRFPELFRKNTLAGAGVHLLPAAFPHPRLDHWQTLIRARAIENQAFFIATNQCGVEGHGDDVGEIRYFGHSMVVDPWGKILLEADETEGLHLVEIDLGQIDEIRAQLTALADRRPEIY